MTLTGDATAGAGFRGPQQLNLTVTSMTAPGEPIGRGSVGMDPISLPPGVSTCDNFAGNESNPSQLCLSFHVAGTPVNLYPVPSGDSAEASTPARRYHQNGVLRSMEQGRLRRQESLDLGDGAWQRPAQA